MSNHVKKGVRQSFLLSKCMSDNGCNVSPISGEILIMKIHYFATKLAGCGLSEHEDCLHCRPSIKNN